VIFVLDASITCAWFLPNQATDYSRAVYRAVINGRHQIAVPQVWQAEVLHVLLRAFRGRRLIDREQCDRAILELSMLPVAIHELELNASELYALAWEWDTSGFDTVYLALAQHLSIPIAGKDNAIARAAERIGVRRLRP
jgi:predicted nucleic acid-binding protein